MGEGEHGVTRGGRDCYSQLSWTLITHPCLDPNMLSPSMPLLGLMAYVSRLYATSFLSNSHSILHISFRMPDATVHSQASLQVSLEVRQLLFPFISPIPSQTHRV